MITSIYFINFTVDLAIKNEKVIIQIKDLHKGCFVMKEKVLRFLQKEIDLGHIPGAVIHVAHKGETILEEAIGYKTVYPKKEPMTLDTVFDLASLTKVVATLPAILKLLDEGEIFLEDEVQHFLPAFTQNGKEEITIKHLLTHTSGLMAHRRFNERELTAEKILTEIFTDDSKVPVGSKVIYSDLGLIALYKIVETVTKEDFASFLQREFFDPLNMLETGFHLDLPKERFAATEYCKYLGDYKRGIVHDENAEAMGGVSGHAGLFSTVKDLKNFSEMIEGNGVYNGKRLLSENALKLSKENFTSWDSEYRGLGWHLKSPKYSPCGNYFSAGSYGHTGFTGTSIWFDPIVDLRVILLTNRVHFGREPHIIRLRPRLHNLIRTYV